MATKKKTIKKAKKPAAKKAVAKKVKKPAPKVKAVGHKPKPALLKAAKPEAAPVEHKRKEPQDWDKEVKVLIDRAVARGFITESEILHAMPDLEENVPVL